MNWEMLTMFGLGFATGLLCWVYYLLHDFNKSFDKVRKNVDELGVALVGLAEDLDTLGAGLDELPSTILERGNESK